MTSSIAHPLPLSKWSALLLAAVMLSQCATQKKPIAPAVPPPPPPPEAYWKGDGVSGPRKIVIDLSDQQLRYFKGGQLVGVAPISSGRESHSTKTGSYRIQEKDIDHRSSIYGSFIDATGNVIDDDVDTRKDKAPPGARYEGAGMRYFMRVTGGIGMHEGYLPGYPASHGCIRLPTKMAAIFYNETPVGTPVEIVGHASLAGIQTPVPIGADPWAEPVATPTQISVATEKPARAAKPPREKKVRRSKQPKPAAVPPGTTLFLVE